MTEQESMSGGRGRLSADRWRELIGLYESGDLTVEAFCESHGLKASTFHTWRRRLKNGVADRPGSSSLVQVGWGSPNGRCEVFLPNGIRIQVPATMAVATIKALVAEGA